MVMRYIITIANNSRARNRPMTSRKSVNETWTGIDIGMMAFFSIGILYEWANHIRFALAYGPAIPVSARRELLVFAVCYGVPWIAYCVHAIRNKWSFTYAVP